MPKSPKKWPDWKRRVVGYAVAAAVAAGVWFMPGWFGRTHYPEQVVVMYTGEVHGLLYTCNCPTETDGSLARRATLLAQLRDKYPQALVVDAGRFTAGGQMDEYAQNVELDRARSEYMCRGMGMMKYTAAAVGPEELAWGEDFLAGQSAQHGLPLVSCNIRMKGVLPYLIRETAGHKVALIGITGARESQVPWTDPVKALPEAIAQAKAAGAGPIIVLSSLSEAGNRELLSQVKGVHILIGGYASFREPFVKADGAYLVRSSWQGRRLGVLSFAFRGNEVTDFNADLVRLSDAVPDDPAMSASIPACFVDANCKLRGVRGECEGAGTPQASCRFPEHPPVHLTVVTHKECIGCQPPQVYAQGFKKYMPSLEARAVEYPGPEAEALIKRFGISTLPVFIFGPEVAADKSYPGFSGKLQEKDGYYLSKTELSGIDVFLDRPERKGALDVFFSITNPSAEKLLDSLQGFDPQLHFLAVEQGGRFEAASGTPEVEESLRGVCVKKHYPQSFIPYLRCRAKAWNSTWWDECALGMDPAVIKACARSEEGAALLRENIALNKELQIMLGPVFLADNKVIFAGKAVPSAEELQKVLKRNTVSQ